MHRIFQPRHDHVEPDVEGIIYRDLASHAELADVVGCLTEDSVVICLCGMLVGQEPQYGALRDLLLSSPARLGAVSAGSRPPRSPNVALPTTRVRLARAWTEVKSGRMSARAALRRISVVVRESLGGEKPQLASRERVLDWAWTGPGPDVIDSTLVGPVTTVRVLHSWDYDSELRNPVRGESRSGIVFIESMGPLHPDFEVLRLFPYLTPEVWFSYVTSELATIEQRVGEPIVIAAHPRARDGELDSWYPGFHVTYGKSRDLIAHARLVLAAEPSTALGFCAMYETPALLLRPPRAFPDHLEDLASYEESMGLATVSAREFPSDWERLSAPGDKREKFLSLCIRNPNAPRKLFWETVAEDILSDSRAGVG